MLLVLLAAALVLVTASPARRLHDSDTVEVIRNPSIPDAPFVFTGNDGNLNEMLQEVEKLMEDSDYKLKNAVKEMEAEQITTDRVKLKDLPPNYHNESIIQTHVGNDTIVTKKKIDKETDNKTGSTFISETILSSLMGGEKRAHECIVDEDCGPSKYCYLSDVIYQCRPCREEDTCTRDGECCSGQMCVWGHCKQSKKGESGTVCESRQDCAPDLCCAMHENLLFPVCTPLPARGEQCQNPNQLLNLLNWELEDPLNYCPCASGLECQAQSPSSMFVCEEPSVQKDKRDQPGIPAVQEDTVYEDWNMSPTGFGSDSYTDLPEVSRDADVAEPRFVDYI